MTVVRVGRSRVRIPLRARYFFTKASTGLRGCFPEGETLNSHQSSADLKNVWRYTSTPPTFRRGVHMDYAGGDTREQVTGQLNLPSVELKMSSIVITINKRSMVGRASRLRGLESRVVWMLNVWTREVVAGRNFNDGSLTLHSILITTT